MNDPITAIISVLFFLLLFDLQLNTLNNWYTTNTVNAIVLATRCVVPIDISYKYNPSVPSPIMIPISVMCVRLSFDRMFSSLGGMFMMFSSDPSIPSDCAGGPSIIMFIQRSCIGLNGSGIASIDESNIVNIAAMFVDS